MNDKKLVPTIPCVPLKGRGASAYQALLKHEGCKVFNETTLSEGVPRQLDVMCSGNRK